MECERKKETKLILADGRANESTECPLTEMGKITERSVVFFGDREMS